MPLLSHIPRRSTIFVTGYEKSSLENTQRYGSCFYTVLGLCFVCVFSILLSFLLGSMCFSSFTSQVDLQSQLQFLVSIILTLTQFL